MYTKKELKEAIRTNNTAAIKKLKHYLHLHNFLRNYNRLKALYALTDVLDSKDCVLVNSSTPTLLFWVSTDYLARCINSTHSTINRLINYYVTLGLLNKYTIDEAGQYTELEQMSKGITQIIDEIKKTSNTRRAINVYSIPFYTDDLLSKANDIAEVLNKGFSSCAWSKAYIELTLGQEHADRVYPYDHAIYTPTDDELAEIAKVLTDEINTHGYLHRDRAIELMQPLYPGHDQSRIKRDLIRYLNLLTTKHDICYGRPTKAQHTALALPNYKSIYYIKVKEYNND